MSDARTLTSSPGSLGLYARAALPLLPGASLLPFVGGRGKEIPTLALALDGVRVDHGQLADYAHVCGFTLRETLPATYLHIRAFPLHMALMTDSRFPFPAVGLVHLSNRITVHRPLAASEAFDLHVHATPIASHPKGRTFTIVTEARVAGELVWEDHSTMLRRGGGSGEAEPDAERADDARSAVSRRLPPETPTSATGPARSSAQTQALWSLQADLGRRYASVSGDRNPIHLHQYTARLFGFPKAIAHGMWTKAHCLAALEGRLPGAYTVEVSFRKPILLPGKATFAVTQDKGTTRFAVASAKHDTHVHLEGTVTP